jgi:hypothetical protein
MVGYVGSCEMYIIVSVEIGSSEERAMGRIVLGALCPLDETFRFCGKNCYRTYLGVKHMFTAH